MKLYNIEFTLKNNDGVLVIENEIFADSGVEAIIKAKRILPEKTITSIDDTRATIVLPEGNKQLVNILG